MEPINPALQPNLEPPAPINKHQLLRSRITLVMLFVCFTAPVAFAYLALYTGWYQSVGLKNKGLLITPPVSITDFGIKPPSGEVQDSLNNLDTENRSADSLSAENPDENPNKSIDTSEAKPILQTGNFWRLVYILPETCDSTCENRLIQLRQTLIATGPERHRVKALLVHHQPPTEQILHWAKENKADFVAANATDLAAGLLQINRSIQSSAHQPSAQTTHKKTEIDPVFSFHAPKLGSHHLYLLDTQNRILLAYPAASTQKEWLSNGKDILKDLKHLLKVSRIG